MHRRIHCPAFEVGATRHYRLRPRGRKSFNTVLDAARMIDLEADRRSQVAITRSNGSLQIGFEHPIKGGSIHESLRLGVQNGALRSEQLTRSVFNLEQRRVRHEEIAFEDPTVALPAAVYPEVVLPFLLSWQPFDGKTRDLYAWINDRMVARVEYKTLGKRTVELPGGPREAIEMMMYPDLNDWVPLGKFLTRLARPLVPKYHMWYAPREPFEVLRFEGPYGPPGAPEVILELDA